MGKDPVIVTLNAVTEVYGGIPRVSAKEFMIFPRGNDILTVTDVDLRQDKAKGTGRDEVQDRQGIRIPIELGNGGDVAPQTDRLVRL